MINAIIRTNERHPINFVILPLLFLGAIFVVQNIEGYLLILIIAYFNLLILVRHFKYRLIVIFILCLTPVLLTMGVSAYLFNTSGSLSAAKLANLLIMRYLSIALISYSFAIHTPFAKLFDYLIEHKICSVKIGYSLFAAFNSLTFLSEEFNRIQTAYKMRYGKSFISPMVFISLLTTAARYAHNLSISMYCRGINHYKTFVVKTPKIIFFDYALWLINLVIILVVIYTIN